MCAKTSRRGRSRGGEGVSGHQALSTAGLTAGKPPRQSGETTDHERTPCRRPAHKETGDSSAELSADGQWQHSAFRYVCVQPGEATEPRCKRANTPTGGTAKAHTQRIPAWPTKKHAEGITPLRASLLIATSALSVYASGCFQHILAAALRAPAQKLSHSSSFPPPPLACAGAAGLLAAGAALALGAVRLAWGLVVGFLPLPRLLAPTLLPAVLRGAL
ncbi:hypothetical protein CLU85_2802 [Acidovorax sp. 69]|nr:hypothetical protein CLU85_2802 [Acidovorax sp. 69]